MSTVKLDLHHKSSNWTNASLPVTILVGSGYSGNAI
jgi:hypothetical protein